MKYPNASKGLKTIVIAEFIALAASIIADIVSIFALPGVDASESELFTSGVVVIVTIVIYVAAYVLEIFGITAASKDEPAFKVSLFAIIAQIIFFVLSAFFYENETAYLIFSIAVDVAYFFLVHYIIHGIMHLSEQLGRPDISKNGKKIFTVIYIGIIFEVIVRIIEIIYGQKQGEEIALPFDVVANILKTIEYVMFLIFIIKGNKLLKESKVDEK
ncbi:MAG: hypothetical protein IJG99_09080 [Ruminococcus sp.]|nr:hypothetical protein [Ruminococcus sp.]